MKNGVGHLLDFTSYHAKNFSPNVHPSNSQGLMNSKHWTWNPSHPRKAGTSRLSPCRPLPVQFGNWQQLIYPQATGRSCGPSDRRILAKFIQIASKSQLSNKITTANLSLSLHTITYLHKYKGYVHSIHMFHGHVTWYMVITMGNQTS